MILLKDEIIFEFLRLFFSLSKINQLFNKLVPVPHFFSDHRFMLTERSRNVTLLNFFIDLQDYIRSSTLKELK